jgi:hypothetical protein
VKAGAAYERFVYDKLCRIFPDAIVTLNDNIRGHDSGLHREIDVSVTAVGALTMVVPRGPDRCATRVRTTCRRAIRMAAITRGADREELITASTDLLAQRRVHDVEAAARFDWTRLANRGTRERTGSVRRSIEAVTEGLEI